MNNSLYDYKKEYFKIIYGENGMKKYYFNIDEEYTEVSEEIFKVCKSSYDKNRYYYKCKVDRSIIDLYDVDLSTFFVVDKDIEVDYIRDISICDLANKVKQEISSLSEIDRKIAECIFINEMSIRETEQLLNIPKSTVSYRVNKIKKKIKKKYIKYWMIDE